MIVEASAIGGLAALGVAVLLAAGNRDRVALAWAPLIVGTGTLTGLLLVTAPLRTGARPWHLLLLGLVGTLLTLAVAVRRGDRGDVPWATAVAVVGVYALLAAALRSTTLTKVTVDSFEYIANGGVLAATGDVTLLDPTYLLKRQLALPVVHGLASRSELYLPSFAPLVALASLVGLAWVLRLALRTAVIGHHLHLLTVAALLLVVTNGRFVFNAFYVNSHLMVAICALVLVTAPWIWGRAASGSAGLEPLVLAAIVVIVAARPEGFLVAGAFLVVPACDARAPLGARRRAAAVYAVATAASGSLVALNHAAHDAGTPGEAVLMVAAATVAGVVAWVLPRVPARLRSNVPVAVVGVLYAIFAVLAASRPEMFATTAEAVYVNLVLGAGLWGASWLLLTAALLVLAVLRRTPDQHLLTLPLLAFVAISGILALGPRNPYRIGPGDSFNRMLLHVLLIAVVAVAVTATSRPRWERRSTRAGGISPP